MGDFAAWANTTHIMEYQSGCLWVSNTDEFVTLNYYVFPTTQWVVNVVPYATCYLGLSGSTDSCTVTGTYTFDWSWVDCTDCGDPDSCANSTAATATVTEV